MKTLPTKVILHHHHLAKSKLCGRFRDNPEDLTLTTLFLDAREYVEYGQKRKKQLALLL